MVYFDENKLFSKVEIKCSLYLNDSIGLIVKSKNIE